MRRRRLSILQARAVDDQGAHQNGQEVYGNMKDTSHAAVELENIQAWLMDPIMCATDWQPLLTIRQQNPMFGTGVPPVVA